MTAPLIVNLSRVLDELGHSELQAKQLGDMHMASIWRTVILRVLRIANESEKPLDPSEPA